VNWNFREDNKPPFELKNILQHENRQTNAFPAWKQSLTVFSEAYAKWNASEKNMNTIAETKNVLSKAAQLAKNAGRPEFTYEYLKARLSLLQATKLAKLDSAQAAREAAQAALEDFQNLEKFEQFLHPYDKALSHLWHARALQLYNVASGTAENLESINALFQSAQVIFENLLAQEGGNHVALKELLKSFVDTNTNLFKPWNAKFVESAKIDFVTVE
jgi:hypothetical protein